MALLSPGIIQGLAAGFGGDQLLTDLAMKKLQLKSGAAQLKTQEETTSANKVWSRAIMDVLAGSGQTPVAPPIAPQPGEASVPMTQGAAGVPATPSAPGLGGPAPAAAGGAPGPAGPPDPTLAMLGGAPAAAPNNTPSAATGGPMDVSTILQRIKEQNPDLDPGVMSSIVNDHIMPLLGTQQQAQHRQFQDQLEVQKMDLAHQDRVNEIGFKIAQLQAMLDEKGLDREARLQIAGMQDAARGELVAFREQMLALQAPLIESQIEKNKAAAAASLATANKKANAVPTGGAKFKETKAELTSLKTEASRIYQMIKNEPSVVGGIGTIKGIGQAIGGTFRTLTGQPATGGGSSVSQFHQAVTALQDRYSKLLQRGNVSSERARRLETEIQGLAATSTADAAMASMSKVYQDLDELEKNLSGDIGTALKVGQVVDGYIYQGGDPNNESSWKGQ